MSDQENGAAEPKAKPTFGEKLKASWWPDLDTLEKARKATMMGVYAVIISIVFTLIFVAIQFEYFDSGTLAMMAVGLGIYAIVGYFIWRNSRVASVIGFLMFAVDKIAQVGSGQVGGAAIFLIIAIGFLFLNGMRGTFGRHKLLQAQGAVN